MPVVDSWPLFCLNADFFAMSLDCDGGTRIVTAVQIYWGYILHVCLQLVEFICLDSWSGTSIIDWSTGGARCYIIAAKLGIRIRAHSRITALWLLSPGLSSSTLIYLGQFWYILWLNSQTKQTKGHSGMLLQTITKVTDKSHKRNTLMLPMQPNNTLF